MVFNGTPKDQRSQLMSQTWDLIKENYELTSVHGGQTRNGLYWKNSTREWIMKRAFKDYEINREVDEWEE